MPLVAFFHVIMVSARPEEAAIGPELFIIFVKC